MREERSGAGPFTDCMESPLEHLMIRTNRDMKEPIRLCRIHEYDSSSGTY